MRGTARIRVSNWLFGGAHFVILAIAAQTESRAGWIAGLVAMSAVSFFAWIGNYRRYREINNVPTSQVASAAQGYVELLGRAEPLPNVPLASEFRKLPCVWCRWKLEKKDSDGDWTSDEDGETFEPFLLRDPTGECMLDPERAEIHTSHEDTWIRGNQRFTEHLLLPQDPLYALGEFRTLSGDTELSVDAHMSLLLAEWKKDRATLLARFDADQDGDIDLREWEAARRAARAEVEARRLDLRTAADRIHVLGKPADGRVYLISNQLPDQISGLFARWCVVHVVIFIGAAAGALLLAA
jgi:hypothetical protein